MRLFLLLLWGISSMSSLLLLGLPIAQAERILLTTEPLTGTDSDSFIINEDDSAAPTITLAFGSSLAAFSFDTLTSRFTLSHDLSLNGNQILDSYGNAGAANEVLTSDGAGNNEWRPAVRPFSMGNVNANGNSVNTVNATTQRVSTGRYRITFSTPAPSSNYVILLSNETNSTNDDLNISFNTVTNASFEVRIDEQDNGTTAGTLTNNAFHFLVYTLD